MKYEWEAIDIVCGRRVWPSHRPGNGETMIGYCYGDGDDCASQYIVLISLDDGLVFSKVESKAQMADMLNKSNYRPSDIRLPDFPAPEVDF